MREQVSSSESTLKTSNSLSDEMQSSSHCSSGASHNSNKNNVKTIEPIISKETTNNAPSCSHSLGVTTSGGPLFGAPKTKKMITWRCKECENDCLLIREECRCLCGHRLREHTVGKSKTDWRCNSAKCRCKNFFYIVAEGAWILRCRCKHKHTEHDASKKEHPCCKAGCKCSSFDSPFVCNCNHGWSSHEQNYLEKQVTPFSPFQIQDHDVGDPFQVMRGLN